MRVLSGEFVVLDKNGVWKTRTIQRRPVGERWPADNAEEIQFAPWKVSAEDERADGETLAAARLSEGEKQE